MHGNTIYNLCKNLFINISYIFLITNFIYFKYNLLLFLHPNQINIFTKIFSIL